MNSSTFAQLREALTAPDKQAALDAFALDHGRDALSHENLVGLDFSGLRLTDFALVNTTFTNAQCERCVFPQLTNCALAGVHAPHSHFPRLTGCDMRNATLCGSSFGGHIVKTTFAGADLSSCRIGAILSHNPGLLCKSSFVGATLINLDACGAYLAGADFTRATLDRARLSRADLSVSTMRGASLREANVVRAVLARADLSKATFDGCLADPGVLCMLSEPGKCISFSSPDTRDSAAGSRFTELLRNAKSGFAEVLLVSKSLTKGELVMVRQTADGQVMGQVFACESGMHLRAYPVRPSALACTLLDDIATDCAGWMIDGYTRRSHGAPEHVWHEICLNLADALEEAVRL